jgi:gluconolactonase
MRSTITWFAAVWLAASGSISSQAPAAGQGQPSPLREVVVTAIPGVIAAGATWKIAWQGPDNADGLVATSDGGVLFAQEQSSRVRKLDANDALSVYVENTRGTGSIAIDSGNRLLAVQRSCTDPGRSGTCNEPTMVGVIFPLNERRILADSFEGKPLGRLNDLIVHRTGMVYFTVGEAYAVRPGEPVTRISQGLRTNGIMLSPDEKTLYVTNGASIVAFDVDAKGALSNQRDFAKLEGGGSGDGMAVDAAGRLYVTAQQGGVQVFSADGKYLGMIPTPRNAISVAFAGRDKRTLYIVGSGALDAQGRELTTPPGVRNNAKTIFRIDMLTQGYQGRPK